MRKVDASSNLSKVQGGIFLNKIKRVMQKKRARKVRFLPSQALILVTLKVTLKRSFKEFHKTDCGD